MLFHPPDTMMYRHLILIIKSLLTPLGAARVDPMAQGDSWLTGGGGGRLVGLISFCCKHKKILKEKCLAIDSTLCENMDVC